MGEETRAAPSVDRDSGAWWAALRQHQLLLQRCGSCAVLRWPARALCNRCGETDWSWTEASGTGTVASWNVTWQTPDPHMSPPYVVLLVRLDDQDDILVPGAFDGPPDGAGLSIGTPVTIGFQDFPMNDTQDALTTLLWAVDKEQEIG